jgi:mRNA-degrading endonuclease RelE of RelBE toxin-antitoxin system
VTTLVGTTARFDTDVKRLRKKYPDVRAELQSLEAQLKHDERPGDKVPGVGYDVRKVRIGNPSAGRGKRGGFRVVYYIRQKDMVVMLTLYTKTQRKDISPEQIRRIIEEIPKNTKT